MAFADFPEQQDVARLLQRSLERGRLAHAYLFNGADLGELEAVARTLAKTLNCENPPRRAAAGQALDSCDACLSCRKIAGENHPDVQWIRPEMKSRIIGVDQIRDLLHTVHLRPTQAAWKVAVIVAADRLRVEGGNAFLKTLEEPPPNSILILLTTEPGRILETILSRCLRLNFAGEGSRNRDPALLAWLASFSEAAGRGQKSLLSRYQLLTVMLGKFAEVKDAITATLTQRSPLERYADADPVLVKKWEDELTAAIEAEYRRQRADFLAGLQWWFRDVWLETLQLNEAAGTFPQLAAATKAVARRLAADQAMENLRVIEETQRLLATNVQEALALEVGLLKLRL